MRIDSLSTPASRPSRLAALGPFVAASTLALAASGCAGGDEPTQQDYDDVATSVGSLVAGGGGEVASLEDSIDTAHGEVPFGFSSSGSGQFEGTRGGLRYEYEVTCQGADGNLMAACDETTDSASLRVDWSGNYDGQFWQLEVSRTGEWSVAELQTDTPVFNGEGTFDVNSASQSLDGTRSRTFVLSYAASYEDIRWDKTSGVVASGSIFYEIHAERTVEGEAGEGDAVFDMSAEVVFDGSGTARLVLDGNHSYDIDLGTGAVAGE